MGNKRTQLARSELDSFPADCSTDVAVLMPFGGQSRISLAIDQQQGIET